MDTLTDDRVFKIRRNLSDAGCDDPLIKKFLLLEQNHRRKEQYRLLSQHRLSLLVELHLNQYKIDCLDYLVYAMEKEDKESMEFKK